MVCRVVSIEDEPEIAELLRFVLASPELELYCADNGLEGLGLIRAVRPHLVTLDVMLPGEMNGLDVHRAIREDADLRDTPVIMLTVVPQEPGRWEEYRRSPIDLYVTKPFDALRLRSEVERLLGRQGLWNPPQPQVARAFGIHGLRASGQNKNRLPSAGSPLRARCRRLRVNRTRVLTRQAKRRVCRRAVRP